MNILRKINSLSLWLTNNGHIKEAQELEEWAEPWHEEATKEFGADPITEEEYLSKNISTEDLGLGLDYSHIPKEVYLEIMKKENFHPVSAGEWGQTYIGGGVMGKVFRGVHGSQPSVAKIIIEGTYSDAFEENEAENWKEILKAKESFPERLQKHIPEVYHIAKGNISAQDLDIRRSWINDSDSPIEYSIIVMEELKPVPEELMDVFGGYGDGIRETTKKLIKSDEYLYLLATEIKKNVIKAISGRGSLSDLWRKEQLPESYEPDVMQRIENKIPNINENEIFKYLYDNLGQNVASYGKKHEVIEPIAKLITNSIIENFKNESGPLWSRRGINPLLRAGLEKIIKRIISNFFSPSGIPRGWINYDRTDPHSEGESPGDIAMRNIPELSNFLETLETLAKDFGIGWKDLHSSNVMMGNDGNFKIIDVGLYEKVSVKNEESRGFAHQIS